ncbi:MAG: hypothetical protein PHH54_00605 [Candidatus Nanoarchaeia archaeon]|nr:hypothetical protein [Candidatus Nanoarchaeia archaeon]MDD5740462.1 hypothetical protein [Candidatus Nanoarchaeia archaeon]
MTGKIEDILGKEPKSIVNYKDSQEMINFMEEFTGLLPESKIPDAYRRMAKHYENIAGDGTRADFLKLAGYFHKKAEEYQGKVDSE